MNFPFHLSTVVEAANKSWCFVLVLLFIICTWIFCKDCCFITITCENSIKKPVLRRRQVFLDGVKGTALHPLLQEVCVGMVTGRTAPFFFFRPMPQILCTDHGNSEQFKSLGIGNVRSSSMTIHLWWVCHVTCHSYLLVSDISQLPLHPEVLLAKQCLSWCHILMITQIKGFISKRFVSSPVFNGWFGTTSMGLSVCLKINSPKKIQFQHSSPPQWVNPPKKIQSALNEPHS